MYKGVIKFDVHHLFVDQSFVVVVVVVVVGWVDGGGA